MLTSHDQGTLRNHYSLVFPAQMIADITKHERKTSGKFKEKKRKWSHCSQSGPKQKKKQKKKKNEKERIKFG